MKRPIVVILGAGFGGLTAARALRSFCDVVLIDRNNYQTFLPLLYQVSTAGLAADHIAYPIRGALRNAKVQFRMGSPVSLDTKKKTIKLDSDESFEFDYLVVALGSVTNDFGIPGVKEHTLGMKTLQEALHIRSTIMKNFEDLCRSGEDKDFVVNIVGGGPTGVEMAGAIAELRNGPLRSDFAEAADRIKINIIEAGPRLLPSFAPKLSKKTAVALQKLGVEVLEDKAVAEIEAHSIYFTDKSVRKSDITVWTAGVKGETTAKKLHLPYERGRLKTEQTLQVVNHPDIFAIGDISGCPGEDGRFLPMVAPVAMQQGRFLAEQIKKLSQGKSATSFVYRDKGSMATIGRHKAVVQVGKIGFSGIPAWYAWLWLHLFYLLGGRNKLGTLADWIWNYLTFDRSNRHIIDLEL